MVGPQILSFDNLSYQANSFNKSHGLKPVLRSLSGSFSGGEISAIIGPSGCGKTSLLNALSGYETKNVSGAIRINGGKVSNNLINKVTSFIMHDFVLHKCLTVRETMMFAASFRNAENYKKIKKVENILTSLSLLDRSETIVQSLSGGEQKRLSIAIELFDDPLILLLDEPTTGLDSSSANQCIQLLRKLAHDEGKIIISTIHSPSARTSQLFDHIYAIADGCCIYQGSCENLVPFLAEINLICPQDYNPIDFLLEIATNAYGEQNRLLTEKIRNGDNQEYRKTRIADDFPRKSLELQSHSNDLAFKQQVKHLMHRNYLILFRDRFFLTMRLTIHFVIGITQGFMYRNVGDNATKFIDNYRYLVSITMIQFFLGFFSLLTIVPNDFLIIKRETFNRLYTLKAYFTAFVLFDIPLSIVCIILFLPISYVMTDQPFDKHRFIIFFVIILTLSFTAQGFGILIGCSLDLKTTMCLCGIIMTPLMLISSAMATMRDTPKALHWLFECNLVENSIKGSLLAVFGYNRSKLLCEESSIYCHFKYPQAILKEFDVSMSIERTLIVLVAYSIAFRFLAYWILKYRLKLKM